MNKNISTFKGKVVELQARNHALVLTNNRLESTLRGNQYVIRNTFVYFAYVSGREYFSDAYVSSSVYVPIYVKNFVFDISHLDECSSTICHLGTLDILSGLWWNPHYEKLKDHKLLVRKSNISLFDTLTNKTVVTTVKKQDILMTQLSLHFWNVTATFRIWLSGKMNSYVKYVSSNIMLCNWIAFGPLRIKFLFYILTTLLTIVHTFTFVIILLHLRKYAILIHRTLLNTVVKGGFSNCSYFIPTKVEQHLYSSLWLSRLSTGLRMRLLSSQQGYQPVLIKKNRPTHKKPKSQT